MVADPHTLAGLTGDSAVVLLTAGVALIYMELNRPGRVLPGATGLLAVLLALAAAGRQGLRAGGILLLLLGAMVLAADLARPTGILLASIATAALCVGLHELAAGGNGAAVDWPTAIGCGLLIGAATSVLTRLARRARVNKRTV